MQHDLRSHLCPEMKAAEKASPATAWPELYADGDGPWLLYANGESVLATYCPCCGVKLPALAIPAVAEIETLDDTDEDEWEPWHPAAP